jgi:hypothetical protein
MRGPYLLLQYPPEDVVVDEQYNSEKTFKVEA